MSIINLAFKVDGFLKIHDPNNGEVFVDKKNAIHYENISEALADSISARGYGSIYKMAFGNGGTDVSPTGVITYKTPNYTGASATLYNQTYQKIVNQNFSDNTDPVNNLLTVSHLVGKAYTDLLISCRLDYSEPGDQQAFDNTTDYNGSYVFDELGLVATGGKLLTHVIFHPVQKSLNRLIQIDYTVRIQTLTNLTAS